MTETCYTKNEVAKNRQRIERMNLERKALCIDSNEYDVHSTYRDEIETLKLFS